MDRKAAAWGSGGNPPTATQPTIDSGPADTDTPGRGTGAARVLIPEPEDGFSQSKLHITQIAVSELLGHLCDQTVDGISSHAARIQERTRVLWAHWYVLCIWGSRHALLVGRAGDRL